MANTDLRNANKAKKDEFYTQLVDIENELKHYKDQFRDKVVYCNCDDPFESNFFKYFAANFKALELKKLITTSYVKSPIVGGQLPLLEMEGLKPDGKEPYVVEINEVPDLNADGAISLEDVEHLLRHNKNASRRLKHDAKYNAGDFRSEECIELLKRADIVVTNPPFSLFREFVAQLIEHDKKFVIIGNINAVTYKETFRFIMENKIWLGMSIHSGDREFRVPDDYPLNAAGHRTDSAGNKYIRVKGVRWFTNLDYEERHENLVLYKKYTAEEYPKYENYDAINVGKTAEIPADYDGMMGVPITYLDKYNPDQFNIVGMAKRGAGDPALRSKVYTINDAKNYSDLNAGPVLKTPAAPTIDVSTTLSNSSVSWNFTDNASDEAGFKLYDTLNNLISTIATPNISTIDESGLMENTLYTRNIKAYNGYADSSASENASIYTLAGTPTNLVVSSKNSEENEITVDLLPNSSEGLSGYYFSSSSGNSSGWIHANLWRDTKLSCGTDYTYLVKYRNGDGIETDTDSILFRNPCKEILFGGGTSALLTSIDQLFGTATGTSVISAKDKNAEDLTQDINGNVKQKSGHKWLWVLFTIALLAGFFLLKRRRFLH